MQYDKRPFKLNHFITLTALVVCLASVAQAQPRLAPNFQLKDTDGKSHSLSMYKGKVVVIEFFNPECPFIKRAHENAAFRATIQEAKDKGVMWLAINSNKKGSQGASLVSNVSGMKTFKLSFPILLNPSGTVGRAYTAARTPEMVIIGRKGEIVYQGAVDSSRGSKHAKTPIRQFFRDALRQYLGGQPVTQARTQAWGCSIKY